MEKSKIIAYEELIRKALITSDVDLLQLLIADDSSCLNQFGETLTKEKELAIYRSGKFAISFMEVLERTVRIINNKAVTVTHVKMAGFYETPFFGKFCYNRIWQYTAGRFQVISAHCSAVSEHFNINLEPAFDIACTTKP